MPPRACAEADSSPSCHVLGNSFYLQGRFGHGLRDGRPRRTAFPQVVLLARRLIACTHGSDIKIVAQNRKEGRGTRSRPCGRGLGAQLLQNFWLHGREVSRIVLPCAERRTKWQIGTSSSGRTADSGSVNGSSTLSVPAICLLQSHMWPVRLAVQDAALSRRRSPVRIWYGLPNLNSVNCP